MIKSEPRLTKFDPKVIPYQYQVIRDIRKVYDYSLGAHEVLLSGSVGCLREDALIETACGKVPICDIKKSDFLLSFSHSHNRLCFAQGSDAFPKDKGTLYRVVTKHGEFVASGHHHIATYSGNYLPVEALYHYDLKDFGALSLRYPLGGQKSLLSDVLHCWQKLSSLIYHYSKRIHQCDPQLQMDLNSVLMSFPLQDDVQEYGQFFYSSRPEHKDALQEQVLKHGHIFESHDRQSMQHLSHLLGYMLLGEEARGFETKPLSRIFDDNLPALLSEMNNVHPRVLLYFLAKLGIALWNMVKPYDVGTTNDAIQSIEKLPKDDWYWDIKVPNTNNYVSHGLVHHNSAKSILMAHLAVTHCMQNKGARVALGRRALPDLKRTIWLKILEHIENDLVEGRDYKRNRSEMTITFANGSQIMAVSWADGNILKFRSYELSMLVIEELTENADMDFYRELKMRVNRVPSVKENFIICATNPDSPAHPAYKHFILSDLPTRHVYYSVTTDNPFLPESYIKQLEDELDEKMVRRMVYGEWLEIAQEVVYYAYTRKRNFVDQHYEVNELYPIHLNFDFNIGLGKPMSACAFQYIKGTFHVFKEWVVDGFDTNDMMEEIGDSNILEHDTIFYVHGDATGNSKDTRSKKSDYDIIASFLSRYRTKTGSPIQFELQVKKSNPPIRARHNISNGLFCNSKGVVKAYIYNTCPTVDEGLRLTQLKKGSNLVEDDSKRYQHVTTALTYGFYFVKMQEKQGQSDSRLQKIR